jgi:hypothetical protein
MRNHRSIPGDTAAEYHRRLEGLAVDEGFDNVACHPMAQAVANLRQGKTLLLGVRQIGLCKDGTAGGDWGRRSGAPQRDLAEIPGSGQVQAFGLLIQESACSRRTGGVSPIAGVAPALIELNKAESLPPDVQD